MRAYTYVCMGVPVCAHAHAYECVCYKVSEETEHEAVVFTAGLLGQDRMRKNLPAGCHFSNRGNASQRERTWGSRRRGLSIWGRLQSSPRGSKPLESPGQTAQLQDQQMLGVVLLGV